MEELYTSHKGRITVIEYNQLGSSSTSTMVYGNPPVFQRLGLFIHSLM